MIYLIGSIVFTSYLILSFKVCERYGINIFQMVVFNYIACVITGSVVNGSFPITRAAIAAPWFGWACIMGVLFVTLFNMIGITAQRFSVAVASVANKLALVIPVIFSAILYQENVTVVKLIGIMLALIAVVLTCYPSAYVTEKPANSGKTILLYGIPFILFIGSGLLDAIINHTQRLYITDSNRNAYLVTGYLSAAVIGIIILIVQVIRGKQLIKRKNIVAGICVGIPNFFSIWCLVKFLKESPWQSNASIPVNNMGIVLFSTLVAGLLLKERIARINWIGIILSILAIGLIALGD